MVDSLVHFEKSLGQGTRLLPIAGVEGGLAAARLVGVELHIGAVTPEDADGALSNLGIELIDDTGDEEGDALGGRLTQRGNGLIGRPAN